MPRTARVDIANYAYHVLNRAIMRLRIFNTDKEYEYFEEIIERAVEKIGMRIIAYIIMPNHWHFLLYPKEDGDLGLFMHQISNTHTRQVKSLTRKIGDGAARGVEYMAPLSRKDSLQILP